MATAPVPSRVTFLASYPEYNGAPVTVIDAKLAEAARRTRTAVFGTSDSVQDAVMLRAAVLLLTSPHGQKLRASAPDQVFAWEWQLRQLQRTATMGLRVFG